MLCLHRLSKKVTLGVFFSSALFMSVVYVHTTYQQGSYSGSQSEGGLGSVAQLDSGHARAGKRARSGLSRVIDEPSWNQSNAVDLNAGRARVVSGVRNEPSVNQRYANLNAGHEEVDRGVIDNTLKNEHVRHQHNAGAHFNFSLPWMKGVSVDRIRDGQWFHSLLAFASDADPSEPILVLCADITFQEALLNWLIAVLVRQPQPPKNILVVTNKARLCSFVEYHGLPVGCLQLSADSILNAEGMEFVQAQFRQLLVIRMSVMRILNHFGYDVLNLDTDAVLLKNLGPVLERNQDSDIVGTFGGRLPPTLFKKWGMVVCMGAIFIRSTRATGRFLFMWFCGCFDFKFSFGLFRKQVCFQDS